MLLKLYAKVNLFLSEEQMEAQDTYDLGNIATSKEWVWRDIVIPVEDVFRLIAFNKTKTIVFSTDGEKTEQILVAEPLNEVHEKWRLALYEYHNTVDFTDDEQEEEDLVLGGSDEEDEDE